MLSQLSAKIEMERLHLSSTWPLGPLLLHRETAPHFLCSLYGRVDLMIHYAWLEKDCIKGRERYN
jgi:hypothetical protein